MYDIHIWYGENVLMDYFPGVDFELGIGFLVIREGNREVWIKMDRIQRMNILRKENECGKGNKSQNKASKKNKPD